MNFLIVVCSEKLCFFAETRIFLIILQSILNRWLGITKPKFLYEIEEYERMKKAEEEENKDDVADEIIVGVNYPEINTIQSSNFSEFNKQDVEMRLFDGKNSDNNKGKLNSYKQQQFAHVNAHETFVDNNL